MQASQKGMRAVCCLTTPHTPPPTNPPRIPPLKPPTFERTIFPITAEDPTTLAAATVCRSKRSTNSKPCNSKPLAQVTGCRVILNPTDLLYKKSSFVQKKRVPCDPKLVLVKLFVQVKHIVILNITHILLICCTKKVHL